LRRRLAGFYSAVDSRGPKVAFQFKRFSKDSDSLEALDATIDFDYFRGRLVEGPG